MSHKKLHLNPTDYLAYNEYSAKQNNLLKIIFLSGFMSDMTGSKATFLQDLCEEKDIGFIRFDYEGTGLSSGNIKEGSVGRWKENARKIINEIGGEKNILIGSSMGGWIMSLLALEMPEKIHSLIGIASAPDFTERLIWDELDAEIQEQIMDEGYYTVPSDYEAGDYDITKLLIEDGRKHLLLDKKKLKIDVPVTLIHGMKDKDVPYSFSMDLGASLSSDRVEIILQEQGNHRMSGPDDLTLLKEVVERHILFS